ncbi:MAG: ferredoxin reductase family protein [Renibacterium sp.]|nr:ferredoxin reductase family protein [Renibacterium sp.]
MSNDQRPAEPALSGATKTLLGRKSDWTPGFAPFPGVRNLLGPLLIIATFALSALPFLGMLEQPGDDALGLLVGTESILAMSWTFVLAIRTRWSEWLFGGLDRVYVAHRWLGVVAVVLMWWHIQSSNQVTGVPGANPAAAEFGTTLAGIAEPTLYLLVLVSVLRWLPWRLWRLTHKLLIIPFGFAAYHMVTAEKPFGNFSAWGLWFSIVIAAGILGYLIRVVGRDAIWRGSPYRIAELIPHPGAVEILLTPQGRPLSWKPGQFAFLKLQVPGLSEPHPFSIATDPQRPGLRFMVRRLGDWTDQLEDAVAVGDRAFVEGPYGQLRIFPAGSPRRTVWIAGGVGITPFLAALQQLPGASGQEPPILIHAVRNEDSAHARSEVEAAAAQGRIELHYFDSDAGRPLTEQSLLQELGPSGLRGAHVVLCGPVKMTRWLRRLARRQDAKHVESEIFDLRGGIAPDLSRVIGPRLNRMPLARLLSEARIWLRSGRGPN